MSLLLGGDEPKGPVFASGMDTFDLEGKLKHPNSMIPDDCTFSPIDDPKFYNTWDSPLGIEALTIRETPKVLSAKAIALRTGVVAAYALSNYTIINYFIQSPKENLYAINHMFLYAVPYLSVTYFCVLFNAELSVKKFYTYFPYVALFSAFAQALMPEYGPCDITVKSLGFLCMAQLIATLDDEFMDNLRRCR
jgi:hypothetical protein